MTLEHLGILLGFFGAACQAANYAFTKDCQQKFSLNGIRLLLAVHAFMGIMMLVPFIIFRHYQYLNPETLKLIVILICPYLLGQYFSNRAIALSDSSIVSPLLTIKIPIMALIAFIVLGENYNPHQLIAIAVIMGLGFYFSSLSGKLRLGPFVCVAGCCICYCISDLMMVVFMRHLEEHFGVTSRTEQILAGLTYEYVFCFLPALPLLAFRRINIHPHEIWQSKWVGTAWILSMVGIIGCFNLAGVVEGNIVQSLRSVIGVLIAYLFYRRYIKDPGTFQKKLYITAAMFSAVILYYL